MVLTKKSNALLDTIDKYRHMLNILGRFYRKAVEIREVYNDGQVRIVLEVDGYSFTVNPVYLCTHGCKDCVVGNKCLGTPYEKILLALVKLKENKRQRVSKTLLKAIDEWVKYLEAL